MFLVTEIYKVHWKLNRDNGYDKRLRVGTTMEMRPKLGNKKEETQHRTR